MKANGTNSALALGADWIGTGDITVCGWIYLNGWGTENAARIIQVDAAGYFGLTLYASNTLRVFSAGTGTAAYSSSNSLSLGKWYFFSATRTTNGTVNIYIGTKSIAPAQSGTQNQASGTPVAGTALYVFNRSTGGFAFNGNARNLRVYGRILSLEEITNLWSSSK
jgi:hypothetical protein